MSEFLGICAVYAGAQRRAQRDIERAGFGTRVPSFRVSFYREGQRQVQIRPLFPGMVFTYLSPGYGTLDKIEGVRVLKNGEQPLRIVGPDEDRLAELERDCLLGEFNKIRFRNVAGRFVAAPSAAVEPKKSKKPKNKKSAKSRKVQRKRRRQEKRALRNHTDPTNRVAA